MATPHPPEDFPGGPQQGAQPQGYSYPNQAVPTPPGYPVYPGHFYPSPAPPKTNWWAVVSFVLGLFGVIVISVICGIVALSQAKRGQSGRGLAIAGLVLSGLWTLPFFAIIAYGVTYSLTTDRETVAVDEVKVGDCLVEVPQTAEVVNVETVGCEEPHAGEVYAQVTMPDGDFPGEDAIAEEYAGKCETELASYSPAAAKDTAITLYYLHPTEETWDRGDRAVDCIAMTLPPRTGSIKG
jgi:Septum formation/Domain of unknown function (DUF4190)